MIVAGPFCECIKAGLYFSIENDDRVFTGDLFYDFGRKEFQIRGIPSWQGRRTHVLPIKERGPIAISLLVLNVTEEAARPDGKYSDLKFIKARATGQFAAWIEEWYGDRAVRGAVEEHWDIVPGLAWTK